MGSKPFCWMGIGESQQADAQSYSSSSREASNWQKKGKPKRGVWNSQQGPDGNGKKKCGWLMAAPLGGVYCQYGRVL